MCLYVYGECVCECVYVCVGSVYVSACVCVKSVHVFVLSVDVIVCWGGMWGGLCVYVFVWGVCVFVGHVCFCQERVCDCLYMFGKCGWGECGCVSVFVRGVCI